MFEIAILVVQVMPRVQVGGVKQAQGGLRYKIGDGRVKNEGGEKGESLLVKGRECRRQKSSLRQVLQDMRMSHVGAAAGCDLSILLLVEGRAWSRYIGLRDVWC